MRLSDVYARGWRDFPRHIQIAAVVALTLSLPESAGAQDVASEEVSEISVAAQLMAMGRKNGDPLLLGAAVRLLENRGLGTKPWVRQMRQAAIAEIGEPALWPRQPGTVKGHVDGLLDEEIILPPGAPAHTRVLDFEGGANAHISVFVMEGSKSDDLYVRVTTFGDTDGVFVSDIDGRAGEVSTRFWVENAARYSLTLVNRGVRPLKLRLLVE